MRLTTTDMVVVAAYYAILIVLGSIAWYRCIGTADPGATAPLMLAVAIAASTSFVASSLFYVRKLYKDAFAGLTGDTDAQKTSRVATVIYYLARPLFASFISILATVLMFEFVQVMSVGHVGVNYGFLLFTTGSAALIAIVTGVAVERIEAVARHGDSFLRPPL